LERFVSCPKTAQALARRCRILLLNAGRASDTEVADKEGLSRQTVGKLTKQFLAGDLDALLDEPRPGARRRLADEDIEEVIITTLEAATVNATQWSTHSVTKTTGMSQIAISRIWPNFGLKAHHVETFNSSCLPIACSSRRFVIS